MSEEKKCRIWLKATIFSILSAFILIIAATLIFDPFFHYHGPIKGLEYPLEEDVERALNDGIARHFKYDGIITGTSMAENFKASEAEELWGGTFIKVAIRGGSFKEIDDVLSRAFESGNEVKTVVRAIDHTGLVSDKNYSWDGADIYEYVRNDNVWDDVNYLLNKNILIHNTLRIPRYTLQGKKTTSFDEYENWNNSYLYGKEAILKTIGAFRDRPSEQGDLSDEERAMLLENIQVNLCNAAAENPNTEFYLFFSPYSIYYWDEMSRAGDVKRQIQAEEIAIEELLQYPNVKLFSFTNYYDWICNPDNYKDAGHYGEWINSAILKHMKNGEYRLTEDNYKEYIEEITEFYCSYDYDSLY